MRDGGGSRRVRGGRMMTMSDPDVEVRILIGIGIVSTHLRPPVEKTR